MALAFSGSTSIQVAADDGAELVRLRQELAEKDLIIQRLHAQLAVKPVPVEDVPRIPDATVSAPTPPALSAPTSIPSLLSDDDEASVKPSIVFDNLSVFAGFDGSKQPQDFGLNALFGGRYQFDWGVPLLKEYGLGLQVGSALNVSSNAVQVFDRVQGTKSRLQNFTTVGLYQRTDSGFNWGIGYDLLYEQYFGHFHLGQWRGRFGYEWDDRNEVGVNLMLRSYGANGTFNKIRVGLEPIDMATLFYRHTWASGVGTTLWAGLADGHNEANAVLGDAGRVAHPFVYGAQIDAPLSERFTLFGQANFITPPSTGTVDAFLGITFHPVGRSTRARSEKFRPVMAVANNPTFAVDLGRRR